MGVLLVASLAYALMNHVMLAELIDQLPSRAVYKSVLYFAWLACGFVTFFAVLITAKRAALAVLLTLFFASLATNYAYAAIMRVPLSLDVIEWLPHEATQLANVWAEYWPELARAVAKAAALLGAFLLIRRALRKSAPSVAHFASRRSVRALAMVAFIAFAALGSIFQPPNSMAETNLFVFGVPSLLASTPSPGAVAMEPARPPLAEKIVLVVDESVTHEAYEALVAPRLAGLPVTDFGEAAATANCSAPSNALLRWGVQKARVKDPEYDPRTNPMLWGYAKRAGYRTVLIDGQSRGDMHNYVNTEEFELIDEFVPAQRDTDTDQAIAAMLNERLRRPGRELIYVVKRGAHFPYEMNYPEGLVPEDAPRTAEYSAAVRYTTGGFFSTLAKDLPFSRILMIYTSDHGQDFSERAAHCNPHPRADEYSVPLVAITAAPGLQALLSGRTGMRDRASHLNIFPTLLRALGFAAKAVVGVYGPTLAGPPTPYLTYVNLGWQAGATRADRHTVRTTDFVESMGFPRRKAGEVRRPALSRKAPAATPPAP